jgi:hypothetical protein
MRQGFGINLRFARQVAIFKDNAQDDDHFHRELISAGTGLNGFDQQSCFDPLDRTIAPRQMGTPKRKSPREIDLLSSLELRPAQNNLPL